MKSVLMLFVVSCISMSEISAKIPAFSFNDHLTALSDSIPQKRKKSMRFRPSPIVGTSLTYIPGDYFSNQIGWTTRHEFTWSINMAFPINPRWEIGLDYKSITSFVEGEEKNINWMAGPFAHFNLFSNSTGKWFAETGLYMGNICFCYPEYYTAENQFYFAAGAGGEVLLSENFSIDIAITGYAGIIGELGVSEGTVLYVFGINYQF